MSYQKMKEITKIAKEQGVKLSTFSDFAKFAKKINCK
jgi:hypothetical protein